MKTLDQNINLLVDQIYENLSISEYTQKNIQILSTATQYYSLSSDEYPIKDQIYIDKISKDIIKLEIKSYIGNNIINSFSSGILNSCETLALLHLFNKFILQKIRFICTDILFDEEVGKFDVVYLKQLLPEQTEFSLDDITKIHNNILLASVADKIFSYLIQTNKKNMMNNITYTKITSKPL